MIFRKNNKGKNDVPNIMEMVPVRNREWKYNEERECVDVIQPRFKSSWLSKLVPPKKDPNIFIHLDKLGTFFWRNIDTEKSVTDIGMLMLKEFPDEFEDGLERVGVFARELYRHGFIDVYLPPGGEKDFVTPAGHSEKEL